MTEEMIRENTGENEDEKKNRDESEDIYDKGYGWFVVAACFLCNMVNDGIAYSFGIIMEPMRSDLGLGVGSISLVGGVLAGATMLTGPVAAAFINRFGCRATCIVGSLISSAAILSSSYSSSFLSLLLTYGVFTGVGLGFVYIPAVVAVGEHFRKRLSLATGICVCGSGAGTFVMAPLTSTLLRTYGWRGCNRVMSLFCLACALLGLVMVPNKKKQTNEDQEKSESNNQIRRENPGRNLLFNIPFLLMTLGNIPFAMAIYISYTYIPSMAIQSGLSSSDASLLISVIGISNSVGRFVSGWVAGIQWTSALGITIVTTAIASALCSSLPSGGVYSVFLVLTAVYGFIISSGPTVSTPLIVDLLGIHHLNSAFGILTFARGLAALIGPPAAGAIIDSFSADFSLPFYIASILFGVSAFLHLVIWFVNRRGFRPRDGYTSL